MSLPSLQHTQNEMQAFFAGDLHAQLNLLNDTFEIEEKIPILRSMLDECFNAPAVTYTTGFGIYESAILNDLESALDNVAESFRVDVLRQSRRDLHDIDAGKLFESVRGLMGDDGRIRRAAEELQQLLTMAEDDLNRLSVLVDMLMKHTQRVGLPWEGPPDDLPEMCRAWSFEFALLLLVEIGKMVCIRFAGWEVRFMDQVVPGTGLRARCVRPRTAGDSSASQTAAPGVEDEVPEPPKAGQAKHGRFARLRRRVVGMFQSVRTGMRGKRA